MKLEVYKWYCRNTSDGPGKPFCVKSYVRPNYAMVKFRSGHETTVEREGPYLSCDACGNVYLNQEESETEGTEEMTTLYEVKTEEAVKYATKLAVNSRGEWVMEEKGSGAIFTTNPDVVEEVIPWSFSVQFTGGGGMGKHYHYWGKEGSVKRGDLLVLTESGNLCRVTDVNTRSKRADKEFVGMKVVTETLG